MGKIGTRLGVGRENAACEYFSGARENIPGALPTHEKVWDVLLNYCTLTTEALKGGWHIS